MTDVGLSGRKLHLPTAIAVAVVLHALPFMLTPPSPSGIASAEGSGGVTVSLGPSGRAPGAMPANAVQTMAEVAPPEPVPPTEAVEAMVEAEPSISAAEPPPPPIAAQVDPPDPAMAYDVSEPAPAETVDRPLPMETFEPVPVPEIVAMAHSAEPAMPVETTRAAPTPPLPPRRPARTAAIGPAPQPVSEAAGQAGLSGSGTESDRGDGNTTTGGGQVGSAADYDALLLAWLERHKNYPRRAQMQRRQGIVIIRFVIDGEGRVMSRAIAESSGHDILDREGLATILRASPMPVPPPELAGGPLERLVPIAFSLR